MNNQRSPHGTPYRSPRHDQYRNRFSSPSPRSPNFMKFPNSSPGFYESNRFSPPFHEGFYRSPRMNYSTSSSEHWSTRANYSYSSNSSNSSYATPDVSFGSPYSTPIRRNRHQGNRFYKSPSSSDSNPGHSPDIRKYVDSSMLEDPWKDLMEQEEKKGKNTSE